jgi:hypothetical protein
MEHRKQSQMGTNDIQEKLVATEDGFWWRYV